MYYHGIKREYAYQQYPVLSPRRSVAEKGKNQRQDRRHLLELVGLEPIHLLEEGPDFPAERCVRECFAFGDAVFAFDFLPDPLWQLSRHEVGVPVLDLRTCQTIYLQEPDDRISRLFPRIPVVTWRT